MKKSSSDVIERKRTSIVSLFARSRRTAASCRVRVQIWDVSCSSPCRCQRRSRVIPNFGGASSKSWGSTSSDIRVPATLLVTSTRQRRMYFDPYHEPELRVRTDVFQRYPAGDVRLFDGMLEEKVRYLRQPCTLAHILQKLCDMTSRLI